MRVKKAFTMVELIIVIVTLSILAVYSIPRLNRDARSEAINHILTMMRYTQSLALHDDKHLRDNPNWQRSYWRFEIIDCKNEDAIFYNIGTDKDMQGKINKEESAIDPSNGKYTYWNSAQKCPKINDNVAIKDTSPNIFLSQKYGIKSVKFANCRVFTNRAKSVSRKHIIFDNFGRYYQANTANDTPNNSGVGIGDCRITFDFLNSSINPFTIVVSKESGFIYLQENPKL